MNDRKAELEFSKDRIATSDKSGRRIYLYLLDVVGKYRKRRDLVYSILVLIFLFFPWIKIKGQQSILLNIYDRKFVLFGTVFWATDAPLILYIFLILAVSLAFVTAIWGRVWCGWSCPQTVFTDHVYRRIERWIEGNSIDRKKLDESQMNGDKFLKKSFKWTVFICISLLIAHSFVAYFVGTDALKLMVLHSPESNPTVFLFVLFFTLLFAFDFGWFKEQFCVVVCPYGRFQSVFVNKSTQTVYYDETRGEPRKGLVPTSDVTSQGDCVNCLKCVHVCPTGIDIRMGMQMECIHCTACMDACDGVMEKIKKPKGLIRYSRFEKLSKLSVIIFVVIIFVLVSTLVFLINDRKDVAVSFVRPKESPYSLIYENDKTLVINHFVLDLFNVSQRKLYLKLISTNAGQVSWVIPDREIYIEPGKNKRVDIFSKFSKSVLKMGSFEEKVKILDESDHTLSTADVTLIGPY